MADIKTCLNNIKNALYGKDVRGSIHDGIDAINNEVENTTNRQVVLENTFDQLIINAGNSNAENVAARVKADGTTYETIGKRMNAVDSQLEHKASQDDVARISNGTPLFANSTSEMIDTSRNYVNVADGYLYIYSGGSWVKTNILYQSQGIQDKSVNSFKLDNLILENLNLLNNKNDIDNLIPFDNLKWEQGSLSNNSYPSSDVRLRTKYFIEVEQGVTYDLKFFNNFFTIGINEYNGNLSDGVNYIAWKGYYSNNQTYTPSPNVTKIKLLLAPVESINPLTIDYINNLSITLRKSKSNNLNLEKSINLKVASFNTGLWSDGLTAGVADDKVNEKAVEWRKLIGANDCDLVLAQEFTKFFDVSKTINAYDFIWKFKYKNFFRTDIPWTSSAILSKYVLKDTIEQAFSNGQSRKWIKSYVEINDIKICIINAHLSLQTDYNIARKQEHQELLSLMASEDYVILCGDFNAYSTSEFDVFKNAGYKLANGGDFGWFDTWTNFGQSQSSWSNKKIDNIIVSSNIDIQNVYVDNRNLSDHAPLITELIIY